MHFKLDLGGYDDGIAVKALVTLPQDLGSVLSIHTAVHNHVQLQVEEV